MKNVTDITFLLDRSGSMEDIRGVTIEGFNKFLSEQKKLLGEAVLSLIQFDLLYEPNYTARPIKKATMLNRKTYEPRGTTALLDAIGAAIDHTGVRLAKLPESERPDKVLIVILTDGQENASTVYVPKNVERSILVRANFANRAIIINDMITHQREKYSWDLFFFCSSAQTRTPSLPPPAWESTQVTR